MYFLRSQFQISEFIDDKGTADLMLMSNAFPITYTTNFDNVYETMMKKNITGILMSSARLMTLRKILLPPKH